MKNENSSRRKFLADSGSAAAGGWLALAMPAILAAGQTACREREEGRAFAHLDPQEGLDLEAIAEQVMPADDKPGAKEAGVIWFIDQALGGFMQAQAGPLKSGLQSLNDSLLGGQRFADLDPVRQSTVLRSHEQTPFFQLMKFLTVAGMFAMPAYGGNREKVGWSLLGFEDRHAWQPPFGYYDAEYSSEDLS